MFNEDNSDNELTGNSRQWVSYVTLQTTKNLPFLSFPLFTETLGGGVSSSSPSDSGAESKGRYSWSAILFLLFMQCHCIGVLK